MDLNKETRPALARGVRLQTDPATGEPTLLFPEGVLHLSETAYEIVHLCDGRKSVEEIVKTLAAEYDENAAVLSEDVLDCLRDLYERKLVMF